MTLLPKLTYMEDPTDVLNLFIEQLQTMMDEVETIPNNAAWDFLLINTEQVMFRVLQQHDATSVDKIQAIAHYAIIVVAGKQNEPLTFTTWVEKQIVKRRVAKALEDRD